MINDAAIEYWKRTGYRRQDMLEFLSSVDNKYLAALVDFLPNNNVHLVITSLVENRREGHGPTILRLLKTILDDYGKYDLRGSVVIWLEDGMWPWERGISRRFPLLAYGRQTFDHCTLLMPDPAYLGSIGYAEDVKRIEYFDSLTPWEMKQRKIFWRGAASGIGLGLELQRVQLCLAAGKLPDSNIADIGLSKVVNHEDAELSEIIARHDIVKGEVPFESFLGYRYQIDVDGMSCAWKSLFFKLASRCCVLKVASDNLQWYYDRLVPWKHYVPLESDASNLAEAAAWCFAHEESCKEIADAGYEFISQMTIEKEVEGLVSTLKEILPSQRDREEIG